MPALRRWYQFSLRTLMIAVTLLAVPLGYVGWQAKIVRERKALADRIIQAGGGVLSVSEASQGTSTLWGVPTVPTVRAWMGDDAIIAIYFPPGSAEDDLNLAQEVFPEAEIRRSVKR